MAMNLLAINVGNSRTRLGTFSDGKLTSVGVVESGDVGAIAEAACELEESLRKEGPCAVMLASVNPAVSEPLYAVLKTQFKGPVVRAEEDVPVPIGRQLDPETIVGADRLLNAAGAFDVLRQACVVVDAGTALTVDFIDGAGTFHGGAIAPGAKMMLESLHEHTALLPEVTLAVPQEPIGHSTAQAMLCGVYYGIRGMVRGLVEQYASAAGMFPVVVATGGDAELLFQNDELVDRVVPDLTLWGMAVTHRAASEIGS